MRVSLFTACLSPGDFFTLAALALRLGADVSGGSGQHIHEHKMNPCPSKLMGGGQLGWSPLAQDRRWPGSWIAAGPRAVQKLEQTNEVTKFRSDISESLKIHRTFLQRTATSENRRAPLKVISLRT